MVSGDPDQFQAAGELWNRITPRHTDQVIDAARRQVAAHAVDADDLADLLDVLALIPCRRCRSTIPGHTCAGRRRRTRP